MSLSTTLAPHTPNPIPERTQIIKQTLKSSRQPDMVEKIPEPTSEAAEAAAPESALSPKFAALAQKEKALRARYQQVKAQEEAFKAKEAEYASSYVRKTDLQKRASEDPMSVMDELGLSYDQLTNLILNQPNQGDIAQKQLMSKIQALEEKQNLSQSRIEEQQKQAYEQAVTQVRNEVKMLVDSEASFETIKETGNSEAVVELIKETFQKEGVLLSAEEAATEVENYLIEEAFKASQLKKVQEKLRASTQVEAPVAESHQTPSPQPQLKTLTNSQMTSSSKPLSNREKRERAILAFRGQLK